MTSADAPLRSDWAKFFEEQGLRTIRCAGAQATSCALESGTRCPHYDDADLILYDEMSITPELEKHLPTTQQRYASASPIAHRD